MSPTTIARLQAAGHYPCPQFLDQRVVLARVMRPGLRGSGLAAVCIEMRQANAAMKDDAEQDRCMMSAPWRRSCAGSGPAHVFRQAHVKSRRLWRSLLLARRTVMNEMRSIENVVRAIPREGGIGVVPIVEAVIDHLYPSIPCGWFCSTFTAPCEHATIPETVRRQASS